MYCFFLFVIFFLLVEIKFLQPSCAVLCSIWNEIKIVKGISADMDTSIRQRGETGQAPVPIPPLKQTNKNPGIDLKASGHQTASHVCRYIKLHPLSFTDGIIEQHHHPPPLMQIQLCSYKSKQAGNGFGPLTPYPSVLDFWKIRLEKSSSTK